MLDGCGRVMQCRPKIPLGKFRVAPEHRGPTFPFRQLIHKDGDRDSGSSNDGFSPAHTRIHLYSFRIHSSALRIMLTRSGSVSIMPDHTQTPEGMEDKMRQDAFRS